MGKIMLDEKEFFQLAKFGLSGNKSDFEFFLRRLFKSSKLESPEMRDGFKALFENSRSFTNKRDFSSIPVDGDSRTELLTIEYSPELEVEPVFTSDMREKLEYIVSERKNFKQLKKHKLFPTRSLLFIGSPGVGKTLTAKWLAKRIGVPLLTLDLSSVISSFLGKTGQNIRFVMDYAGEKDSILFLDEVDAIAKKRDDDSDIGELKRLVNVILQQIDRWPQNSLLIAATNHPQLLDPAIWRRFDVIIEFKKPDQQEIRQFISQEFKISKNTNRIDELMTILFKGKSYSEIKRDLDQIKKKMVIEKTPIDKIVKNIIKENIDTLTKPERYELVTKLGDLNFAQTQINEWTDISRPTIRKILKESNHE